MEWTKSCRTLERDLKHKKHPGARIKVIREAKNRVGETKGKFGQNDFCKLLVEKGAIDGSDQARRIYKQFEKGARKLDASKEPIPTVLSLLEVTPELAGYHEEPKPAKDSPAPSSGSSKSQPRSTAGKPVTLKVHNYLEDPITVLAIHNSKNELELIVQHGDSRVDQSLFTDKIGKGTALKELWVRGMVVKFAASSDDRTEIPGKSKAVIS